MTDINSTSDQSAPLAVESRPADPAQPTAAGPPPEVTDDCRPEIDAEHIAFVELLFFAYRDFTGEPDQLLADFSFGRAHHRVLHFVNRNPGLRVADLLDILNITKQSLARVLKQLIDEGFIVQEAGASDRRERLLFVTESGRQLALRLAELQTERIQAALTAAGPDARGPVAKFLLAMVSSEDRDKVLELIKELDLGSGEQQ